MDEEGLTETKHEKIFIGKPGDFDFKYIKTNIEELIDISRFGTSDNIRDKLEEFVPTYKRLDKKKANSEFEEVKSKAAITIV